MYSNKFAAKLVNIRQLCKKIMDNLNIFIVLSTYYFTFRFFLCARALGYAACYHRDARK